MMKPTYIQAAIVKITAVSVGMLTVGSVILMWDDVRPWVSREEHYDVFDKTCINTISRYKQGRFQAQGNRVREEYEAEPSIEIILSARKSEQFYEDLIAEEKRMCGFE